VQVALKVRLLSPEEQARTGLSYHHNFKEPQRFGNLVYDPVKMDRALTRYFREEEKKHATFEAAFADR
jgi:hypothetical protein